MQFIIEKSRNIKPFWLQISKIRHFGKLRRGEPASHSGRGGSLKQRTPKRTPPHTGRFDSIFSKIFESSKGQ